MERQVVSTVAVALRLDRLDGGCVPVCGLELLHVAVARQRGHVDESASDTWIESPQKIALEDVGARRAQGPIWMQHAEQQDAQRIGGAFGNVDSAVAKRVPFLAIFGSRELLNELKKCDTRRKNIAVDTRLFVKQLASEIDAIAFLVVP
jgi:hypothetical protein